MRRRHIRKRNIAVPHRKQVMTGQSNTEIATSILHAFLPTFSEMVGGGFTPSSDFVLSQLSRAIVTALFRQVVPETIEEMFGTEPICNMLVQTVKRPEFGLITLVAARWVVTTDAWPKDIATVASSTSERSARDGECGPCPVLQEELERFYRDSLSGENTGILDTTPCLDEWTFDVSLEDGHVAAFCWSGERPTANAASGDTFTRSDAPMGLDAMPPERDAERKLWVAEAELVVSGDLSDAPLGQVVQAVLPTICASFCQVLQTSRDRDLPINVNADNLLLNLARECVGAAFGLRANSEDLNLTRDDLDSWLVSEDGLTLTASTAKFVAFHADFPAIDGFPVTLEELRTTFDELFDGTPASRFVDIAKLEFSVCASLPDGAKPQTQFFTKEESHRVQGRKWRRTSRRGRK